MKKKIVQLLQKEDEKGSLKAFTSPVKPPKPNKKKELMREILQFEKQLSKILEEKVVKAKPDQDLSLISESVKNLNSTFQDLQKRREELSTLIMSNDVSKNSSFGNLLEASADGSINKSRSSLQSAQLGQDFIFEKKLDNIKTLIQKIKMS